MGFFDKGKELVIGAKNFVSKKPTPQEQQVNTGGVIEPFAPLTNQIPPAPPLEAQVPAPSPEPTTTAVPDIGEVIPPAAGVAQSPDQAAPLPPTSPSSDQQAA